MFDSNEILYTDENDQLMVGQIVGNTLQKKKFNDEYVIPNTEMTFCQEPVSADFISVPHSNSYLDLDGDCMPDIFLTKESANGTFYFEIYVQRQGANQRYCLVQSQAIDVSATGIPLFDFADINRDGMMDLIYISNGAIFTHYNLYPSNPTDADSLCKSALDGNYYL